MSVGNDNLSRRGFFKAVGAVGVGSLLARTGVLRGEEAAVKAEEKPAEPALPTRQFGKTGVKVTILGLGGIFDTLSNQVFLKQVFKSGVTYWDTAEGYEGTRSEQGMGKYFEKNPEDRKKIFLVTKTTRRNPAEMTGRLEASLERLQTDYVDMYFMHGVSRPEDFTDEIKQWVEKTKKGGKIKFFGFSTHKNMEDCMLAAAKLGWVDGLMTRYNYRHLAEDKMKAAVDACAKAKIGLTAMKTQARGPRNGSSDTEWKLVEQFMDKGFTRQQANLKAIWSNPQISCICSQMDNMTVLKANHAAALNKTELSASDRELLEQYARETCDGYCAGCGQICEPAVGGEAPICDVMRYLTYYRDYGNADQARQLFRELPRDVRERLARLDYSEAQRRCPQHLPIAELMRQASELLA